MPSQPPSASLGVVIVRVTAVRALEGEVVGAVAQPAFPTSSSSSLTAVCGRIPLVDVLGRPPTTASTAARLSALPQSTTLLCRGGVFHLRQELHGLLGLLHCLASSCAVVAMVGVVGDAEVVDTLEARLKDARRCHEANGYGLNLPLAVIEAGIRSVGRDCTELRLLQVYAGQDLGHPLACWSTRYPHLEGSHRALAGDCRADRLRQGHCGDAEGTLPRLACGVSCRAVADLHGHLAVLFAKHADRLEVVQGVPRRRLPGMALHRVAYQVTNNLYIGQLEEQMWHIRMGEEETATDYCNRARRILTTMRMVGVHYSTALYLTHEAERPSELLAQVNYVTPMKQGGRPGQRGQSGGGGSSGWKPSMDADKKKSAKNSGRGGGSRRRECWLCGDPNHLSFECPDRNDSYNDNAKGGHGRFGSRRPRRNQPRKENQSTKSSTSAKDADSSAGSKGRDDKEASCSLVDVVEPTVSLALEAGEDFQAMATAV
ncbi:unnamed protein product [Closterium sp. NIES-53]